MPLEVSYIGEKIKQLATVISVLVSVSGAHNPYRDESTVQLFIS
jgi:hypothetical protein